MPAVLIVEDEPRIAEPLMFALEREHFAVTHVTLGQQALDAVAGQAVDLVVLDVGLPDMNGFDVLKQLRQHSELPVLFLTARQDEVDRILGLELGGDDYVTKPFSPREVVARIRAILKRLGPKSDADIDTNKTTLWQVDDSGLRVFFRHTELSLTRSEYRILTTMVQRPGQVFSRAQLLDICDSDEDSFERSVDTHIKTLRAKLRPLNGDHLIVTRRGIGYLLDTP
ncbi:MULTISPECIES: two-component system response regulator CreB [unclassified Alcanivorax]|uniref:two-component system response regulator CreB n=1 Tax=unclassified Alcanivorax TaxID=2638842 RepID=UPI00017ECBDF|nr:MULTISPECIES: two-component system response regulator CreB [unclassified Alcanivorax]EDX90267.1 response regulator receiver domain protein [Alcanivorax sp. DG881]